MECIELSWLCKHRKKVRNSQAAILVLNLVKQSFSLWVSLSEHKIRSNFFILILIPGYTFCYDEIKSTHGGTGFYINDNFSYVKQNDPNISLDNNLESAFIEVNLPKKRILSVGAFINTLIC